ncbi:hypothetical protein [Oscillatoria sp. HE19RPO]|uniref:hypothetical protein n=1 Tax=Oscillatoria sp. HE19RPO TaxID=2954806 RepID=UPI0020C33672|nr:hypothetical protein [Oscillatoria sp. HE19RPO]
MKVRELINILSQFDPETRVVVAGYEGGFNDITEIHPQRLRLNVNPEWYYGSHGLAEDEEIRKLWPDAPVVEAVSLMGENQNSE